MASTDRDLMIDVLRAAYTAGPEPLYPVRYAQARGIDRVALDEALDRLRLGGLLRLTEWVQGLGQGYTLTPAGMQALENPRILDRGAPPPRAPTPADPYAEAPAQRRVLIRPGRPIVTWTLIGANVLVFFVGLARGQQLGVTTSVYLNGEQTPRLAMLLHQMGSLAASDVLQNGEWWRLVTSGFLHLGILHIGLNMYALYVLGPLLEAMWGSARMLIVYGVSLVVGSCFVVWGNSAAVGASGAISGLLTSLGVWVLLNREELPPALAAGLSRMVSTNLVILVLISLWSGVSWQGHLGGAVGGALASFPMQLSRHGDTRPVRLVGTCGAVLVGVLFVVVAMVRAQGLMPF
jgi:rhomboid protease GluP